ncbi:MAG: hypothetical protein ACI8ZM_005066 [Crocinitomix sp.]|jgi:hypothetical protein
MKVRKFFKICAVLSVIIVAQTACEKDVEILPVDTSDTDSLYTDIDSTYTDECDSTDYDLGDCGVYDDDSTGTGGDTLFILKPSIKK